MSVEQDLAASAVEQVMAALGDAAVEAAADRHRLSLTRFANSVIHQNVAEDVTRVRLRIHHDGRTASASATVIDTSGLRALVERAADSVKVAPRDPGWPGVAPPAGLGVTRVVDPASADVTPADRAKVVRAFVDGAGGFETAGYCRTNHWTGSFANSAGHTLTGEAVECGLSGIARNDGADGVARHAPLDLARLDGAALGARAAAKARASAEPTELPPGHYEVVLEPTAVADIVETLAAAAFNGKAVNERRSFVRLGEGQFDPAITLVDDPLSVGIAYDNEGTPRQRLVLVERGTTVSLTHDRRTATEAGTTTTGHAAEMVFDRGPCARHLGLLPSGDEAGVASEVDGPVADSSVAELVAGVERGVLVSDFWYTRMLDPRTLAITGLTRNGVWLIEDGHVASPLRNFRFTQSYAQALMPGNVKGVGRSTTPLPGDTYTATAPRWSCPALHLASWNFTGGASG
ncbi:MAG TPA: metallopeptidase TldD-related protein [Ilumatobacteraceae bacterium]|nr:metallopeptidase TldD-related protein [Ilumatobacteraceae bacterium]